MQTIGITGGTGFIGTHLCHFLTERGHHLVIFTRNPGKQSRKPGVQYSFWNPSENKCDLRHFKDLDAVVNLAGAGIADKRWTEHRKKLIRSSRIDSTAFLVEQLQAHAPKCKTLISASAIGYYGPDRSKQAFTEDMPPAKDFLAETCWLWEEASKPAEDFLRRIVLRFGIVLGKDGGAFPSFEKPQRLWMMPILGSGRQTISWIHIDDLCALIDQSIAEEKFNGVYNAVTLNPVSFKQLMLTIAKLKGGMKLPFYLPQTLLKLALGEVSSEVVKSSTVSGEKLRQAGFQFQYDTIEKAAGALLKTH